MKFADKYEILEMVTSGRVSTFLARERASQEPVVVYMFECAGSGAELSTASIIARFCSLAPNPPGIIVKAGFDDPSSSAFITTKMPDSAALQAWVGAYHAFGKPDAPPSAEKPVAKPASAPVGDETAELSAWEVRSVLAKNSPQKQPPVEHLSEDLGGSPDGGTAVFSLSAPTPAAPPRAVPHSGEPSGGEFTRLFREVNAFAPVKSNEPPAAPAAPKPSNATDAIFGERLGGSPLGGEKYAPVQPTVTPTPAESSPGSFTREFMGLSGESVAPTPRQTAPVPRPPVPAENEPGAFTREFMAVSQDAFKSPDKPSVPPVQSTPPAASFDSIFGGSSSPVGGMEAPPENQKGGAGEFTSFFRDPFEHPGAPSKSIEIPDLASSEPTKPQTGEFTRMFGRDDIARDAPAPLPPLEREPPPAAPGSFTQMFGDIQPGKSSEASKLGAATLGTNPNLRPSFLEPSGVPAEPPVPPRSAAPSTPAPPQVDPFFARTPAPFAPPANQTFMNRPGSTTDVFRMPGGEAPPVEQAPSGPSEFTVFLSRSQINASLPPEPAVPPANAAGGTPVFGMAPPPSPPPSPFQFAPPPPPPAPPAMKFPPMPAPPAAPAVPRPPGLSGAPKAGSIWPLITVLTVLAAIGILLVMYFLLKH